MHAYHTRWLLVVLLALAACGPKKKTPEAAPASPEAKAGDANGLVDGEPAVIPVSEDNQEAAAELSRQAEKAWANRSERIPLEEAISLWERAQVQVPNDPNVATSLARAYYFLGDGILRFAGETDAMLDTFEKGILAGQRALMGQSSEFASKLKAGSKVEDLLQDMPPNSQGALYWYASNLGRYAATKGLTTMLFYRDRIFAVMTRVLALDEGFYYGGPHRYLGAFYAKAPSFAGGDLNKSKQHFEKALTLGPNFFGNKVLYAELYAVRADDKGLFTRLLKEVVDGDPNVIPEVSPEQKNEQEKARRLLSQTDELF